jgi:hypothetical protein
LLVDSLSPAEQEILNLPKFMMTSTNLDSLLFRREMDMLKELITKFDADLRALKRRAIVVPGRGDYYSYDKGSRVVLI